MLNSLVITLVIRLLPLLLPVVAGAIIFIAAVAVAHAGGCPHSFAAGLVILTLWVGRRNRSQP